MEDRPKILLTNFHFGTGGGHRTYILSLLKSSLAEQFDFALSCPASSPINVQARESRARVYDQVFPGGLKHLGEIMASVRQLEQIQREFPFDILHCNGSRDHWIALYWRTFYRRPTRIIRTRHAVKRIRNDPIHAWAYGRATDLNMYVSRGMIPLCEPLGALKLTNSTAIPNGVDTDYFAPRERDQALASQLGIREIDFVIGSNAGLGTHKRADLMIRAVAQLPNRNRIKIILLGEKRSADNYLRLVAELGLAENLICDGMLDDVRAHLSLVHLGFVLSESIETSSYAAKEMMAMGLPLICSRYSGLPENVDEGRNGYLVTPGAVDEICACVSEYMALDPGQRAAFGARSREKAILEFSRRHQLEAMARVYRDLAARSLL